MSSPVPWTVVSHGADDSIAATSVVRLMAWLDELSEVDLHTVLWAAGPSGTRPYDFGRLADVGSAHERSSARLLRAAGLSRLGGGMAGRAVRSALRGLPIDGFLYLNTASAGAVLRYLPPGPRTVVTHLHAADRVASPQLSPERVDALKAATHVWFAVDEDTRDWASTCWGLDPEKIHVVPEPVDPAKAPRAVRVTDPNLLRLGLRGATWFRRDHAPRLVQELLRRRPCLELELVWTEPVGREHIGPQLHDLRQLGLEDRLEVPADEDQMRAQLGELDVLAFTTPDDDMGWILADAGGAGVPMVCFDTHRSATGVVAGGGLMVPYLDLGAMAEAVLGFLDQQRSMPGAQLVATREDLRSRTMPVLGPRILGLARRDRS